MSLACLRPISIFLAVSFGCILASEDIPDDIIPILYLKYKEAVDDAPNENMVSLRRILNNNREYKIHVKKLKEVNGFKRHNLVLRSESAGKTLIYVNNPVETKIPNAYLSLDEFKKLLTDRASKHREKFKKYATIATYMKPTRTVWKTIKNIYDKPKNIENTEINELYHKTISENTPKFIKLKHKTKPRAPSNITSNMTVLEINTNRTTANIDKKISKTNITKNLTTMSYRNTVTTTSQETTHTKELKTETTLQTAEPRDIITYDTSNIEYSTEAATELHSLMTDHIVDVETNATFETTTQMELTTEIKPSSESTTRAVTRRSVTKTTTTKPTRRTLSRPLVFMGGFM